jgi:hypothetical protein
MRENKIKKIIGFFLLIFFKKYKRIFGHFSPCEEREKNGEKKIFFFFFAFLFSPFLAVFLAGPRQSKRLLSPSLGKGGLHVSKVLFYAFFPALY